MAKGKFEGNAPKTPRKPKTKPAGKRETKLWPILLAAGGALVVIIGAVLLITLDRGDHPADGLIANGVIAAGVDLSGMDEEQALAALEQAAESYATDMRLTLTETTEEDQPQDGAEPAEPIELLFPAAITNVTLNPQMAYDEAYRVGRELSAPAEGEEFVVDAERYLTMDTTPITDRVKEVSELLGAGMDVTEHKIETHTERREVEVKQEDGTTTTEMQDVQILVIELGTSASDFKQSDLYDAVMEAYARADFDAEFSYTHLQPEPIDIDALFDEYCTEPVDATFDETTYEIIDEVVGYGFDREELEAQLEEAEEGDRIEVVLQELVPEVTAEKLQASLFTDVLGSYDSPHTANSNRTTNLILACQAIDGTVLMPGEVFSFNKTVGIRSAEKGYKTATAYVSGGASAEELGGGVCQVASTIYYSALLADLKIVERTEHMYAVTYVPYGMDATVYWGSLDFQFENSTNYPLRIDASVSGGYVHIALVGTDERDYTVKMTYNILATIPWEVKEVEDDSVPPGTVITTAYTGYKVETYMHKIDKNGNEISVEFVARSNYNKRDREIAVASGGGETTEPTEPPTTEPPTTEPTEPPTTEPPTTEPTEPPTTEPPAPEPTDSGGGE